MIASIIGCIVSIAYLVATTELGIDTSSHYRSVLGPLLTRVATTTSTSAPAASGASPVEDLKGLFPFASEAALVVVLQGH